MFRRGQIKQERSTQFALGNIYNEVREHYLLRWNTVGVLKPQTYLHIDQCSDDLLLVLNSAVYATIWFCWLKHFLGDFSFIPLNCDCHFDADNRKCRFFDAICINVLGVQILLLVSMGHFLLWITYRPKEVEGIVLSLLQNLTFEYIENYWHGMEEFFGDKLCKWFQIQFLSHIKYTWLGSEEFSGFYWKKWKLLLFFHRKSSDGRFTVIRKWDRKGWFVFSIVSPFCLQLIFSQFLRKNRQVTVAEVTGGEFLHNNQNTFFTGKDLEPEKVISHCVFLKTIYKTKTPTSRRDVREIGHFCSLEQ